MVLRCGRTLVRAGGSVLGQRLGHDGAWSPASSAGEPSRVGLEDRTPYAVSGVASASVTASYPADAWRRARPRSSPRPLLTSVATPMMWLRWSSAKG
jgi:hypothetical protein